VSALEKAERICPRCATLGQLDHFVVLALQQHG
jgi:hypothetical protein